MDPRRRVLFSVVALIVIVIGMFLFSDWFSKTTGYVLGEDQKVKFALCLKEKNTVLYITSDCYECERQEKIIGSQAIQQIKILTCEENLCGALRSVPAWEINSSFYYGVKTYEELETISGCEIN